MTIRRARLRRSALVVASPGESFSVTLFHVGGLKFRIQGEDDMSFVEFSLDGQGRPTHVTWYQPGKLPRHVQREGPEQLQK